MFTQQMEDPVSPLNILFVLYVLFVPVTWHPTSPHSSPLGVHRKDSWTRFAAFQRLENCQLLLLHKPLKGRNSGQLWLGPWDIGILLCSSAIWHYRNGFKNEWPVLKISTWKWRLRAFEWAKLVHDKNLRLKSQKQKKKQPLMDYTPVN